MASILWHSCAPWAPSGYGTQTAIWIKKLKEMGHEVTVSSYWGITGSPIQWDGINILPGFGQHYCSSSLYEHYQRLQPDLVISLGDVWVMDPNLLKQMPIAHWLPADCRPMSLADSNVVNMSGAELVAMSRFGYDRFKSAGFDPVYMPHGIDTELFMAGDREAIREQAGVGDMFIIGINGANNDAIRKALPEQMLAFAKFLQKCPDSLLYLHTGTKQEGGQDLEAVGDNLGISDRVRCVDQYRYACGLVSQQDLAVWYNVIDVLAACAYGEGFGLPIIESQACGTPVITTDASSMTEVNPYGLQVTGEPFWNGVHKGWWTRPSIPQMVDAFEQAYENRKSVNREQLREFALGYDKDVVAERHVGPAIDELVGRMRKRGFKGRDSDSRTERGAAEDASGEDG